MYCTPTKKMLKKQKRGLTKAAAQSIIFIVLCDGCIAPEGDSIKKASEMERTNCSKLVSAWDTKEVLYRVRTSTATPKPRAEGSIPSAPARIQSEQSVYDID